MGGRLPPLKPLTPKIEQLKPLPPKKKQLKPFPPKKKPLNPLLGKLNEDTLKLVLEKLKNPVDLKNCSQTNQLIRHLSKDKLQEFHRRVNEKLEPIKTKLAEVNGNTQKVTVIDQNLKELIQDHESTGSFIELEVSKKLMIEFPKSYNITKKTECLIMLELDPKFRTST